MIQNNIVVLYHNLLIFLFFLLNKWKDLLQIMLEIYINEPYSLLIRASYLISWSEHAQFTSVTFVVCKWHWGCRHFYFLYLYSLYRSYQFDNKVIGVPYI